MAEVKKVTAENVQQLHAFTIKHFVEYYDLQTELTDHLANAIETRWQQEPNLTFDEALKQEFKKFGIFGFMTVVEQRQAALSKRYYKLCRGYLKGYFRLPKVILSVMAALLLYKAATISPVVFPVLLGIIMVLLVGRLIYMAYKYRRKIKKTGQRWMFEEIIYRAGGAGMAFIFPFHLNNHIITGEVTSLWLTGILSVWTVLFALYEYVILFYIPAKAKEHLITIYPEYSI